MRLDVPTMQRALKNRLLGILENACQRRRRGNEPRFWPGAPVTFFIWNAHSMGGTVRTVLRQAGDLANRGHPVTVVSVVKHPQQHQSFFAFDPRVRHEVLLDRPSLHVRAGIAGRLLRWLDSLPTALGQISLGRESQGSFLVDLLVLRRVFVAGRGVVIGTRLGLNLAIARFGHPAAVRVAQEHLFLDIHPPVIRRAIRRAYPNLDVVACLTQQDATAYRRLLAASSVRIEIVPNSIPNELPPPSSLQRTRIVAVGRFSHMKGFDLLLEAFARIADEHPTWELRLIGRGPDQQKLQERIARLGLVGRVEMPGPTKDVPRELSSASIFVLSSRFEPFGIVLLEAMASGLCIVSFACPMGPVELIDHGRNGLLVPPKKVDELAAALKRTIEDKDLRERLGAGAREDAARFSVSQVGERWIEVFSGDHAFAAQSREDASEREA